MRSLRLSLLFFLVAAFAICVPQLTAVPLVTIDHVDGVDENGYFLEGSTLTFHIRFTSDDYAHLDICNGYSICSDNLTWGSVEYETR
jgi:hypothetical protein